MASPYDVLGVTPGASLPQIHSAYRRRALQSHPDRGGSSAQFQQVQEAYQTLKTGGSLPAIPIRSPAPIIWLNILLSAIYGFTAALSFVSGESAQGYNGWFTALGWICAVLAWRTFATRKLGLRNPIRNLVEGVAVLGLGAFGLIWRLACFTLAILLILGVLSIAERVLHLPK